MELAVETIAMITGVVAIWFAIRESRRSNAVILKIAEAGHSFKQSVNENRGQMFSHVTIVIKNCGIALHSVHASIRFHEFGGAGSFNLPFVISGRNDPNDSFEKGMVLKLVLKSYAMDALDKTILADLIDAKKQNASLVIASQGYVAASFPLSERWRWFRHRWNSFAHWVDEFFYWRKGTDPRGKDFYIQWLTIPKFIELSTVFDRFVKSIHKEVPGNPPSTESGPKDAK